MTWSVELVELIVSGRAREFPRSRVDDLIAWTINRDTPATRLITTAFSQHSISRDQGVQLSLAVLDGLLFSVAETPWQTLGLAADSDEKHTRIRYRRLLGIFHPDRQLGSAEWCHERTDKLNQAFRLIQAGEGDVATTGLVPDALTPGKKRERSSPKSKGNAPLAGPSFGDALREWMGGSRSFQKKFFSLLIAGAALVLLLFYYAGLEPEEGMGPKEAVEARLASQPPRTGFIDSRQPKAQAQAVSVLESGPPEPQIVSLAASRPGPEESTSGNTSFEVPVQEDADSIAATPSSAKPEKQAPAPLASAPVQQISAKAQTILAITELPVRRESVDPCKQSDLFVADFSERYQSGNLDGYLDLYTENAVENDIRGKSAIRDLYADFFATTSHRAIVLKVTGMDSPGANSCRVSADFSAQYFDQSGQHMAAAAQIQFQLAASEDGRLLISLMQY